MARESKLKTKPGRIIWVTLLDAGKPVMINGVNEFPAIVVRAWSDTTVNCRVFQDNEDPPIWETSVPHRREVGDGYSGPTWRWPDEE